VHVPLQHHKELDMAQFDWSSFGDFAYSLPVKFSLYQHQLINPLKMKRICFM
jgi:hypothetical protein